MSKENAPTQTRRQSHEEFLQENYRLFWRNMIALAVLLIVASISIIQKYL